ncbi:MAG: phosphatase PAP2 family protein [Clostridiaceae bacterium]|nr:phosphatase PAP2 family protein [Clostridiaceae bacterium]
MRGPWIAILLCLAAFLVLGLANPWFDTVNLVVRRWVNRTRRPQLRSLMILTHHANDILALSVQLVVLSLLAGLLFHDWYRATVLSASVLIQTAVIGVSKQLTSVDRPPQIASHILMTTGSYPSGHSSVSLSCAFLIPAVFRSYLPPPLLAVLMGYLLVSALLTAYGRLYLDVHWLTDIFGGWLLAAATVLISRMLLA